MNSATTAVPREGRNESSESRDVRDVRDVRDGHDRHEANGADEGNGGNEGNRADERHEGGRAGRGRPRHRRPRRAARGPVVLVAAGAVGLAAVGAGCLVIGRHGGTAVADGKHRAAPAPARSAAAVRSRSGATGTMMATSEQPARIPGLGPRTRARIPASTRQVLVASGKAPNSSETLVTLWSRTAEGRWRPGATWEAHNARDGWTGSHRSGDLHSPIGVFTLHDAGGFEADPGSKLPYYRSPAFRAGGVGFDGEPLDKAFDYVIAIDYNRVAGTSPLDGTQPLGADRGGGIWVHVDHGGPTHGCVSIPAPDMVTLLRTLVPADHPVIVMGDQESLAD